jgi:hypothetical protein
MNQKITAHWPDVTRRHADRSAAHRADAAEGEPALGWTVVLRRQPSRFPGSGRYTNRFELICCECGDDPSLDYWEASPEFQRLRGPYLITAGIAAYRDHVSDSPSGRPHHLSEAR